jgi:hypothetical protein
MHDTESNKLKYATNEVIYRSMSIGRYEVITSEHLYRPNYRMKFSCVIDESLVLTAERIGT